MGTCSGGCGWQNEPEGICVLLPGSCESGRPHSNGGGGVKGVDNDPASSKWPSLSAESLKVEEGAGEPSSVM